MIWMNCFVLGAKIYLAAVHISLNISNDPFLYVSYDVLLSGIL